VMLAMPARASFLSMCSRILRSSPKSSAKSLSEYQLLRKSTFSPLRLTPSLKPSGCTFWPIYPSSLSDVSMLAEESAEASSSTVM
jgi:hypothetical protein